MTIRGVTTNIRGVGPNILELIRWVSMNNRGINLNIIGLVGILEVLVWILKELVLMSTYICEL